MPNDFETENGALIKYHGKDPRVVIPEGVTKIKFGAFSGCTGLTSVTIPDSVAEIGSSAFSGCTGLTSFTVPDSVRTLGNALFSGCTGLTSVKLPESLTVLGQSTFYDCTGLTSFSVPSGITDILDKTFRGCSNLTSVSLPNGLKRIEEEVFMGCKSLQYIVIPDTVTGLGKYAFTDCKSLVSFTVPDSVTEIGSYAFLRCTDLTAIVIPESVSNIGMNVFLDCPNVTVICKEGSSAHNYCIRNNLTFIFDYQFKAFNGVLPKGLEMLSSPFLADEERPNIFISYSHRDRDTILPIIKALYESGWRVWYDEGLTIGDKYDETLEDHVKYCSAFLLFVTKSSLNSMYIRDNEIPWAIIYKKPIIKCILDEGLDYVIDYEAVTDTVSPSDIEPALEKISGLTKGEKREAKGVSVAFDPAQREGSGGSFAYCLYTEKSSAAARAIMLEARNSGCTLYDASKNGEDPQHLRDCASLIVFLDKSYLADGHLTRILTEEFYKKRDIAVCLLEDIEDTDLPGELLELHLMQWLNFVHGITSDMTAKLARHLQKRGCRDAAVLPGFEYEETPQGIVIKRYTGIVPNPRVESVYNGISVVKIGDKAFENCNRLKSFTVPDGVISIGESAFARCPNLTSVTVPDSVKEIGRSAFESCTDLSAIRIPDNVIEICDSTFKNCTSLTSIILPDSISKIGASSFFDCTSLKDIIIPDSVTQIGDNAFSGCKALSDKNGFVTVKGILFSYFGNGPEVCIPDGVQKIGNDAFTCRCDITSVIVPGSVKEISYGAFQSCEDLISVNIPDGVTQIQNCVFKNCKSLVSLTLPDSIREIGIMAFDNCPSLKSIALPVGVTRIGDAAFRNCPALTSVIVPDSVTDIGISAFMKSPKLTVTCRHGSNAWKYCKNNNVPVKAPGLFSRSGLFGKK